MPEGPLYEEHELIWDDRVAAEMCIDFDASFVPTREVRIGKKRGGGCLCHGHAGRRGGRERGQVTLETQRSSLPPSLPPSQSFPSRRFDGGWAVSGFSSAFWGWWPSQTQRP